MNRNAERKTFFGIVGVLVEVPVMLSVCNVCNRTRHWFADGSKATG